MDHGNHDLDNLDTLLAKANFRKTGEFQNLWLSYHNTPKAKHISMKHQIRQKNFSEGSAPLTVLLQLYKRLDGDKDCLVTFVYSHLKTALFSHAGVGSASE